MKKKWINKTVCALVALAMVFGLCFYAGEQAAQAAVTGVTIQEPNSSLLKGNTLELHGSATAASGDVLEYAWTSSDTNIVAFEGATNTANATIKAIAATGTADIMLSVTVQGSSDPAVTATITITATGLTIGDMLMYPGQTTAPTLSDTPAGGYTLALKNAADSAYVKISDDKQKVIAVGVGSATVVATGVTNPLTAEFLVKVDPQPAVTVTDPTSLKIAMTNGGNAAIAAVVSTGGGNLTAVSSNTNIVRVVDVPTGDRGTITIMAVANGTANITIGGTTTTSTQVIAVTVGTVTPVATLTFNPDVNKLAKGESTVMTVHVDNPEVRADGNAYAKIALANRRVVVSDYNYSKVNDREYWVKLDANGNASVTIKPQYNGTVKVTVTADKATAVSRTFTVSGHPTLPQTGQNFTLIYVFGACCLAAVATWVVLYARKKKNSNRAA